MNHQDTKTPSGMLDAHVGQIPKHPNTQIPKRPIEHQASSNEERCGLLTPLAVIGEYIMVGFTFCVCLVVTVFFWSVPAFTFVRNAWKALVFWLTVDKVCSWCCQIKHQALFHNGQTTHGICLDCLALQKRQMGLTYEETKNDDEVKRTILRKLERDFANHGSE